MSMIKSHFHQVVHGRGHGFSKRFNPAGVHYCTHTHRTLSWVLPAESSTQWSHHISPSPRCHLAKLNPPQESGRCFRDGPSYCPNGFQGPFTHWGAGPLSHAINARATTLCVHTRGYHTRGYNAHRGFPKSKHQHYHNFIMG